MMIIIVLDVEINIGYIVINISEKIFLKRFVVKKIYIYIRYCKLYNIRIYVLYFV